MIRDVRPATDLFGIDRPQPHNLEAEQSVLGSIIKEPELLEDAISILQTHEVFYSNIHRTIFQTIIEVHNSPDMEVDAIAISEQLRRKEKLEEVGGELYLFELFENLPTTANFENWCMIVKEYSAKRSIINQSSEAITMAFDSNQSSLAVLDTLEHSISDIRDGAVVKKGEMIDHYIIKAFEEMKNPESEMVSYGLAGLHIKHYPGDMHVIAAGSGTGKTTFALTCIVYQALSGIRTVLYCTETSSQELSDKCICILARVDYERFQDKTFTEPEKKRFFESALKLQALKEFIFIRGCGDFVATPAGINADIRAIQRDHGPVKMAWVDYLQDLDPPPGVKADDENSANTINTRHLKNIFRKLNIALTLLAQITRKGQENGRPRIYHLKYAGKLENAAHIISFLYDKDKDKRDKQFEDNNYQDDEIYKQPVSILMYTDKMRNGRPRMFLLERRSGGPHFIVSGHERKYGEDFMPDKQNNF
jgi:replicative DNA helicase